MKFDFRSTIWRRLAQHITSLTHFYIPAPQITITKCSYLLRTKRLRSTVRYTRRPMHSTASPRTTVGRPLQGLPVAWCQLHSDSDSWEAVPLNVSLTLHTKSTHTWLPRDPCSPAMAKTFIVLYQSKTMTRTKKTSSPTRYRLSGVLNNAVLWVLTNSQPIRIFGILFSLDSPFSVHQGV